MKNESDETERFEIVAVNKLARLLLTTTVLLPKSLGRKTATSVHKHLLGDMRALAFMPVVVSLLQDLLSAMTLPFTHRVTESWHP